MRDDGDDPPARSRLARPAARSYRTLSRERFPRQRRQLPIAQLIGRMIERHGLTEAVRQRAVCLYWREIAGERVASKAEPSSFREGVLYVAVVTSAWIQELQFGKASLIARINSWVDANRVWLGAAPLVADLRFALGAQGRQHLVDRDHAEHLRRRHLRRLRPARELAATAACEDDREAILRETSAVGDADLRAVIEAVRLAWNR